MRRLTSVLFGTVLGGAIAFVAFQYHVVRTNEGHLFVPKKQTSLVDFYVDVRNWDASKWREHPALIQALEEHGREDLVVKPTTRQFLRDILKGFGRSSQRESPNRNE